MDTLFFFLRFSPLIFDSSLACENKNKREGFTLVIGDHLLRRNRSKNGISRPKLITLEVWSYMAPLRVANHCLQWCKGVRMKGLLGRPSRGED
ncbi:hypothetical protein V6Z11_A08G253700 [Gossypium hirsutum]